jgi:hypothetical protein
MPITHSVCREAMSNRFGRQLPLKLRLKPGERLCWSAAGLGIVTRAAPQIGAGNKHHPNGSLTVKGPKRVELAGALGSDGQRNAALNW